MSALNQFIQAVIEATDPETWNENFTDWGNLVKTFVCPDYLNCVTRNCLRFYKKQK